MEYLKKTSEGEVDIGATIKAYLDIQGIAYSNLASKISMSRSGMFQILAKPHITTDRLIQISKATGHNFFKYYIKQTMGEERRRDLVGEPEEKYVRQPKRTKVVLELEDGKVISQATSESHLLDQLISRQEEQWEMLMRVIKDTGSKMAVNADLNPANMELSTDLSGTTDTPKPPKKRQRGPKRSDQKDQTPKE